MILAQIAKGVIIAQALIKRSGANYSVSVSKLKLKICSINQTGEPSAGLTVHGTPSTPCT